MPDKLKPFIHIVANLYMKHGFKEYPEEQTKNESVNRKNSSK